MFFNNLTPRDLKVTKAIQDYQEITVHEVKMVLQVATELTDYQDYPAQREIEVIPVLLFYSESWELMVTKVRQH